MAIVQIAPRYPTSRHHLNRCSRCLHTFTVNAGRGNNCAKEMRVAAIARQALWRGVSHSMSSLRLVVSDSLLMRARLQLKTNKKFVAKHIERERVRWNKQSTAEWPRAIGIDLRRYFSYSSAQCFSHTLFGLPGSTTLPRQENARPRLVVQCLFVKVQC